MRWEVILLVKLSRTFSPSVSHPQFSVSHTSVSYTDLSLPEPRGWTAFHAIGRSLYFFTCHSFSHPPPFTEGAADRKTGVPICSGMVIKNNQFGPSGTAPSPNGPQFGDPVPGGPGYWADGLSLACKGSSVTNNGKLR